MFVKEMQKIGGKRVDNLSCVSRHKCTLKGRLAVMEDTPSLNRLLCAW